MMAVSPYLIRAANIQTNAQVERSAYKINFVLKFTESFGVLLRFTYASLFSAHIGGSDERPRTLDRHSPRSH